MTDEGEKTYEVKDKRRVNADGTMKEEPVEETTPPTKEQAQESEQAATPSEAPRGEMPIPSVYDMLQFVVGMLSEQAWVKMGLRLAPGQREMEKDLAQAKLAIDTVVFIADKLHPHISEDERRTLRGLVSDLQVNFVRQNT